MERFIFAGPFGFIMPERIYWSSVTYPFFPAVMRRVENVAYKGSLRLVLCNTDNDPQKEISYLNELRTYRPAGGISNISAVLPEEAEAR